MKRLVLLCGVAGFAAGCSKGTEVVDPYLGWGGNADGSAVVVGELFTADWCPPCSYADSANHILNNEYTQTQYIGLMIYANGDAHATANTIARNTGWGVTGIPTMFIDGVDKYIGGGPSNYASYKGSIDNRLALTPRSITLRINAELRNDSCYVDVAAIPDSTISNAVIVVAVAEDDILHNRGEGPRNYGYGLHDIISAPMGDAIVLTGGDTTNWSGVMAADTSWVTSKLVAVAWIQIPGASTPYETLQGAVYDTF